jgi:hypothetical protein
MKSWFSRSFIALLVLITLSGTAAASLDIAGSLQSIRNKRSTSVADTKAGVDQVKGSSETDGEGFYLAIYADTVKNPNTQVEEQIKKRFGIDFKVDLLPPKQSGKAIFTDFFKNPSGYHNSPAVPTLRDSLQSDCVRIRAAQVDDKARQLSLLNKRLKEKKLQLEAPPDPKAPATPPVDPLIREELLRLIDTFDTKSRAQLDQAIKDIPDFSTLTDQQVLLSCYQDLSRSVDFEMKLQTILNPSRKQLEALQTFTNGRLDDFSNTVPLTNFTTGQAFPKYDLLFDLDVIDYIFFGTAVGTNLRKPDEISEDKQDPGGFGSYQNLQKKSQPSEASNSSGGRAIESGSAGSVSVIEGMATIPADPFAAVAPGVTSTEFGASSKTPAGPYCADAPTGLNLDYSGLNAGTVAPASTALTQEEAIARLREEQSVEGAVARSTGEPLDAEPGPTSTPVDGNLPEGPRSQGKNSQGLCQGSGAGFGNELFKLIFCVDIDFAKTGKTWETSREDNCIACHLYEINRIFEKNVLKASVRPHKNTGTIMESAICEDGYGSAVGFQYAIEWVPVKFYKDICYPQGGVTSEEYADLVGYPEIVARVNKPGSYVDCKADFKDEKAQKRCLEVIGGPSLTYEVFAEEYLKLLDPYKSLPDDKKNNISRKKIQSTTEIDKKRNIWARLVGEQGIAEREVHLLLYQLGKDSPRYGEEKIVKQDFKTRLDYLTAAVSDIQRLANPVATSKKDDKLEKLLCLKGYTLKPDGADTSQCSPEPKDTFRAFERDVNLERDRVAKLSKQWNARSRDFNQENPCGMFAGSGLIDAANKTFADKFSWSYYLNTPQRKTQTPEEQLTGQISANTEVEDINRLLTKIDEVVGSTVKSREGQRDKAEFQGDQEKGLQLYEALVFELATFRANIRGMTDWWADMVVNKQFVSKGGQKQNVLENFLEKLR